VRWESKFLFFFFCGYLIDLAPFTEYDCIDLVIVVRLSIFPSWIGILPGLGFVMPAGLEVDGLVVPLPVRTLFP
jgi:hypothetical protein